MFALIENGAVSKWPLNFSDIRKLFPNVSFTIPVDDSELLPFDIVSVVNTPPPSFDFKTQRVVEVLPVFSSGVWEQAWAVESLTPEEQVELFNAQAASVRAERNQRLAECDWTQLADSPLDADAKLAWQLYRETLRMVPEQAGFPWNVEWPPVPGS